MNSITKYFTLLMIFSTFGSRSSAQFKHPGLLHSAEDLAFIAQQIKSKITPWSNSWEELQKHPSASLNYLAEPFDVIKVGYFSKPDIGGTAFMNDGNAAYTMAIQYCITGKESYAIKATQIIDAWAVKLDSITDQNALLNLGMHGFKYLNAAELLKYKYQKWDKIQQTNFKNMLLNLWYPLLKNYKPTFNGNWDFAIGQTLMAIGIYLDDKAIFDLAYQHTLKGKTNGSINNYINKTGQNQESGRDQTHTQMGLSFLTNICDMAWNQGLDLYGAYNNRLLTGYEYTAKYMLGEEVPYVHYIDIQGKKPFGPQISAIDRGRFHPVYERVYHHYHHRKGLPMPYTQRALEKTRIEGYAKVFVSWSTLMRGKLNSSNYPHK